MLLRASPCVRGSTASAASRSACVPRMAQPATRLVPRASTSEETKSDPSKQSVEDVEKYGLEVGLIKVLSAKENEGEAKVSKTDQAKQLLTQYGSAYLITSGVFALISFSLCYVAVETGINVPELLSKIGIQVNDTSESVGTFAIAYAAHKALSPVRFPPTVALTPVVAKWTGKKTQPPSTSA